MADKTPAQLADERANPSGKSTTEMTRELMEKRKPKEPIKEIQISEPKTSKEVKEESAAEKAYNKSDMMSGEEPPKKMAKGGKVRSIDGIAQRGKTKLGRG